MKRRISVGILLFPDVEVLDFAGPYEVFSRTRTVAGTESRRSDEHAPFEVFTVAKDTSVIQATGGLSIVPDFGFDNAPEIALLVVPGGFGSRPLLDDERTLEWIRETSKAANLTSSVCSGSLLLAEAGLLDGRRATSHWGAIETLKALGRERLIQVEEGKRYVDDGIITSAGVSAGIDMAFYVVEKLLGAEIATETAHYIDYLRARQLTPD